MGIITNGPFNEKHDGLAEAYKKIRADERAKALDEATFADKFKSKREIANKNAKDSPTAKKKDADRKNPDLKKKVEGAKKRWLEHIIAARRNLVNEEPVVPTLATKLKGTPYGALKPQSEVGKKKPTNGSTPIT